MGTWTSTARSLQKNYNRTFKSGARAGETVTGSHGYVYYKNMNEPIGDNTDSALAASYKNYAGTIRRIQVQSRKGLDEIPSYLRDLSQGELAKEREAIRNILPNQASIEFPDISLGEEAAAAYIKIVNSAFGIKDIYQRRLAILKFSEQKESFSWLAAEVSKRISKNIGRINESSDIYKTLGTIIYNAFEYEFFSTKGPNSKAVQDAFLRQGISTEEQSAYEELREELKNNKNEYTEQLIRALGLNEILNQLSVTYGDERKKLLQQVRGELNGMRRNASTGGNIDEITGQLIMRTLSKQVEGLESLEGGQVGHYGAAADEIYTINYDFSFVQDALDRAAEQAQMTRQHRRDTFNNIANMVNNMGDKNSFIIYVSDKNYTWNANARKKGMAAGTGVTARQYMDLFGELDGEAQTQTFIGYLINHIKGAIAENHSLNVLKAYIASNIAYLLFDDFTAIGADLTSITDTHSIHLFRVNGVVIPLSVFLERLANSLQLYIDSENDHMVTTSARVSIKLPDSLFKATESAESSVKAEEEWLRIHGGYQDGHYYYRKAWEEQREHALDETFIEVNFMRDFKQFINTYYEQLY